MDRPRITPYTTCALVLGPADRGLWIHLPVFLARQMRQERTLQGRATHSIPEFVLGRLTLYTFRRNRGCWAVMQYDRCIPVPRRVLPLLSGFAFQMIAQAVHEAQRGDRLTAACAIRWLRARTDWSRIPAERRVAAWGSIAPSQEARDELPLTFEWCCQILGIDPEDTRKNGPPYREANLRFYLWKGGLADWRLWRESRRHKRPLTRPPVAAAIYLPFRDKSPCPSSASHSARCTVP